MVEAVQEVQDILSGRPGGVNRFLRRWGKLVIDYATAIIPDRSAPFEKMVEDIFVDAVSQCRAAARVSSEEEVQAFIVESALRTVRSRYREQLDAKAKPALATTTLTFQEVISRSKETEETLHEGISSGRIRAVRAEDQMRVDAEDIPELQGRKATLAYFVSAAERELLCLHFRLKYTADEIAKWSDRSAASLESLIHTASNHLSQRIEAKQGKGPEPQDAEMRRYIEGGLSSTDTAKFEQKVLKDKIAQERINQLRSETEHIRDLFKTSPYDLSHTAINVRERNPHRTLVIPPSVAIWVQVAALVAIILVLHNVGAYIAPPSVEVTSVTGEVVIDGSHSLASLHEGKLVIGQRIETKLGAQALVVLDDSNSIRLAEETSIKLREPRKKVRQVIDVTSGEIWGKFVSSGHAFAIGFEPSEDKRFEVTGDQGAEFDLAVGEMAQHVLPDNLPESTDGSSATAVLRVFRGVVLTGQVGNLNEKFQPIGRDQWVVYFDDGQSFSGRRGDEDFRTLRFEGGNRYKDRLHWLNTKSYPLRSQNSLLELDRKLRELADELEEFRSTDVIREGGREISVFREQIKKAISDAEARIADGKGKAAEPVEGSLSDEALVAAREQILGDITYWLKQSSSGAYPTLGAAAKTLNNRISADNVDKTELDARIGEANVRKLEIIEVETVIANITDAINELKKHKLNDSDGSKRAALQAQIDEQDKKVQAGRAATGRIDILRVRLNGYDDKIDNKRRQLPALRKQQQEIKDQVAALEKAIKDNRYTPELVESETKKLMILKDKLVLLRAYLDLNKQKLTSISTKIEESDTARTTAQKVFDTSSENRDLAVTELETASTNLELAKADQADAQSILDDLQKQLDSLPEGDSKRNQLEQQIKEAERKVSEARVSVAEAIKAHESSVDIVESATKLYTEAELALTSATTKLSDAKTELNETKKSIDGQKADVTTVNNKLNDSEVEIDLLNELKTKLATDKTDLGTRQTELTGKTGTITTLESDAGALENKAAPHREKLKEELAIVEAGKTAAKDKVKIQAEKDRYDAHGEDIERREVTLAKKLEIRKQLKESDLVKNYAKTVSDFETIASRVDAMEWLRHRGIAEDTVFELKQSASLDLYLELVNEAERKAINILSPLCAEYSKFKLNKDETKSTQLRSKLLSTLWRLYYSSEELAETAGITCYYVAVQSGANVETFKTIDLKWKEALSRTLDEKTFKLASKLESTDLAVAKQTEE